MKKNKIKKTKTIHDYFLVIPSIHTIIPQQEQKKEEKKSITKQDNI